MKIAIVTAFPPSKVTLTEYGYHLVKHFAQKDEISEIVLITDHTEEEKQIDFKTNNCKITVKDSWKFNSYKNVVNIYKAINEEKPDAVLFNLQFMKFGDKKIPAALGLLLPMIFKLKRIPSIVLLHNILEQVDLNSAGFASNKLLQKAYNFIGTTLTRFLLKADLVAVTIGKYVEILNEKYKADNVVLIPHGAFETPPEPSFELPKGPKKVMTFGKFGTYKKVEIMIEAVQEIRKRTSEDIEIVIAGTDSPNTPGYLENVKKQYAHVPNITFTGYVEESDVPVIFDESAVVVFPYTSTTGSSGVLHQAGSYGKAVVLPDLGDLSLLVKDEGYRGEFFNPTSTASLADAIQEIITKEDYRMALGKNNYKAACSLPMETITDMYIEHFNTIAARNAGMELVGNI
ncbi:glycosyltransferase [Lutibacter flavus]|uniref:Glycosyltransferase involved in cell wall bisynthesis n=1 Tax=Lutibacter flavus TaxID=691689 RepID=A0A238XLA4_9FLAO|nr:glycosyltransferase [Lutibacter flavus]SNR59775.1 Glycosyltransferase involved in cell wall bisynthesis [Lutibacter flavus]